MPRHTYGMILGLAACAMVARPARADDVQGQVSVVGSAEASRVVVTPPHQFKGQFVCPGASADRVRKLDSFIVQLSGDWKDMGQTGKCLDLKTINVQTTPLGHTPVVGTLSAKNGVLQVTTDDGKVQTLANAPDDGLKNLDGKKMILDLKPAAGKSSPDGSFDVITYMEFP